VPPGHRLRRLAVDLARAGTATIVRPERLSEDDVSELTLSVAADRATPELARRVYVESEGLPLFVAEYLVGLGAGADDGFGPLSPQARGLLDGRLAGLDETARQVLGAAAAIGRSFDPETLRRTSGRSDEETVTALEELVVHGLVREGAGDGAAYDFSHQKLRELVYEQTALARRQLLHGRVAAALSGSRPVGDRAALVAQHLRLAGDHAGAAEHYRLAAEHAASLYAHADALEHLQSSLALGHPDVAGIHERIGDVRTVLGDYGAALAAYEAAAAYSDSSEAVATIEHKLGNLHHRRGEWDRAESHLVAALAAATDQQQGLRARVQADLGLTLLNRGDPGRATELARDALALAEEASDRQAEAQAHNMLGVLARSEGSADQALEHLERSLELARQLDDAPAEAAALNNLALLRRDADDLPAALELTERALALCSRYGDRHREAALENNLADLHHAAGREEESMAHLKRAVTIFREVGADEAARLPEIWKLVSW
jgi:tetratricopeptide (TPR) repeat protein